MIDRRFLWVGLVVLLLGAGGLAVELTRESDAGVATGIMVGSVATDTVTYTDTGFDPRDVTVQRGTSVTFQNGSTRQVWPASDFHPTHLVYPEKGGDCGTSTFDACRAVEPGSSVEFRLVEVGSWDYHDHLRASKTGTVTVYP